jgi:hypothetical protein
MGLGQWRSRRSRTLNFAIQAKNLVVASMH